MGPAPERPVTSPSHVLCTAFPKGLRTPRPVIATRRLIGSTLPRYLPILSWRYCSACPTVRSSAAASSGMSMSNSFSKAITSSTVSRLSAPRSSMKLASDVSLSRSTPSSSTMMSLTFSSSCFMSIAMAFLRGGEGIGSQHQATADDQQLPRNVAREVGGEKEHGRGHVCGLCPSPEGDSVDEGLPRLRGDSFGQLRFHEAGGDGVDEHVAGCQLLGHRLGEPDEPRLGRRVVRLARVPPQAHDASDVDDAAVTPLDHPTRHVLRHQEGAFEVGVQNGVPVVVRDAEHEVVAGRARVVHEDRDRAQLPFDRRDGRLHLVGAAHVARIGTGGVVAAQRRGDRLRLRAVAGEHGHLGARPVECRGDALPDAAAAARHDGDPTGQVDLHAPAYAASRNVATSAAVPTATTLAPGMTRFAPRALQASPARRTAAGSPEITVWSGALRFAGVATAPSRDASRQAASTWAVARPSTAAIVPGRSVPAWCISSPRLRTSRAASGAVRPPAVIYAEYSPSE